MAREPNHKWKNGYTKNNREKERNKEITLIH